MSIVTGTELIVPGVGDTRISTIDPPGIALAAIQGLYEKVEKKEVQIEALQKHNSQLEKRLAALEALLSKTERVEVFADEASALAK